MMVTRSFRMIPIVAIATLALATQAFSSQNLTLEGRVVGVSDGDTIKLLTADKKEIRIRFYGVDCPESKQAFGVKAKQYTSDRVFNQQVRVVVMDTDRYGRSVGKVYFKKGRKEVELNLSLINDGFAWWYKRYSPEMKNYGTAEESARKKKVGLWADTNPVAPWDFRKQQRSK